jgi:serine/threonine protein kinase
LILRPTNWAFVKVEMKPAAQQNRTTLASADSAVAGTADTADLRDELVLGNNTALASSEESIGAIWEQMRLAWTQDRPLAAEQFLTDEFLLQCGMPGAVDIIYGEYALAEAAGAAPSESDFLRRFPQYAEPLGKQLSLHRAIQETSLETTALPAGLPEQVSSNDQDSFACPGTFGRYVLVAPLDRGGQSSVYRALHPELGKEIVLKIAHAAKSAADAIHNVRLADEGKILAGVSHPNLAQVYDAGCIDGRRYLALEYIRGTTLAQYARQHRPAADQAAQIVAKIAHALGVVHAQGILHLDIKPKNIVIDEQGEPRLIDFGLARAEHAWTAEQGTAGISGTLEFMAPEQTRGEVRKLGPATDVFSLGGVLYFLLTGTPLYTAKNAPSSLALAERCRWNREALAMSAASPAVRRCCERALAPQPTERYPTANEFAAALDAAIQRKTPKRWPLYATVAGLLLLVAGLGMWLNKGRGSTAAATLSIQVWQEGIAKDFTHALPLRNGDELRFEALLPGSEAATLVLINAAGELRVVKAQAAGEVNLVYPDRASVVPLTGKPGSEALLVISGSSPPTIETLQAAWKSSEQAWPAISDYMLLQLTDNNVSIVQSGRDLGNPKQRIDPSQVVQDRVEHFRRKLRQAGFHCAGYVFAHSP